MIQHKILISKSIKGIWVWLVLFSIAVILGAILSRLVIAYLYPSLSSTIFELKSAQGANWTRIAGDFFTAYIAKALIAMVCLLSSKAIRGIFPVIVVVLIGSICGISITLININTGYLLTGITFYYLFDLFSLFWACSIGLLEIDLKEKMYIFIYPMALLLLGSFTRLIHALSI